MLFGARFMSEDHVERRRYLRFKVRLQKLQVTVAFLGFELATGVVLNVSRGGLKVALSRELSKLLVGHDCLVRFLDPEDRVSPEAKVGKLRRMEAGGEYAIEFDSPLEVLNVGSDPESVASGTGATSDAGR